MKISLKTIASLVGATALILGIGWGISSLTRTAAWKGETKVVLETSPDLHPIAIARAEERELAARQTADSLRAVATALKIESKRQLRTIYTLRARYDSAASERDSLDQARVLIPQQAEAIDTLERRTLTLDAKLVSDSIARADADALKAENIARLTEHNERLADQLRRAPALQAAKSRKFLWILPHPGDAVVFVAGAVAGGYVVSRIR